MSDQTMNREQPTREQAVGTVAGLIKDIKFAMLVTTTDEGHLHARPMTTQQTEFDGDLWFIGAKDSEAVHDMRARPQVNVSYADTGSNNYVSVHGTAELVEDRAKLDELWSDMYDMYFEGGKEDPNVQLIKIDARGAEYWESGGKVRTLFALAKNLIPGQKAEAGELGKNETVEL
ncbi:pyridoxamine 5'-phosphate oxidase family protein [Deinococcus wulumuqiensis]